MRTFHFLLIVAIALRLQCIRRAISARVMSVSASSLTMRETSPSFKARPRKAIFSSFPGAFGVRTSKRTVGHTFARVVCGQTSGERYPAQPKSEKCLSRSTTVM
jgi:hypothetical protein